MKRVAIVGSGIAGLGTAWFLRHDHEVTVFDSADYAGGHAHTASVDGPDGPMPVDTGFIVFNHVTYPNLVRLFDRLGVPTQRTDMSFSVQHQPRDLEFSGTDVNHLFAQRRNLFRPWYYRMLLQVDRFNDEAVPALSNPEYESMTLAEYVQRRGYGEDFLNLYLIPMSSAVWSTPPSEMLRFPATTLLRFFHNHGFLGLHTQHPWWTVSGGSRMYVAKIVSALRDGVRLRERVCQVRRRGGTVEVTTERGVQAFDRVVLACHPPTSLELLGDDATADERRLLSAFRYHPNTAVLHTDERVMPRTRMAWAAWNYRLDLPAPGPAAGDEQALRPSSHHWMNRLQNLSGPVNYFISINGGHLIDPARVLRTIAYDHPLFDLSARAAQREIGELNIRAACTTETYFAGAWQRYGFHEDGLLSAVGVAELLLRRNPWTAP